MLYEIRRTGCLQTLSHFDVAGDTQTVKNQMANLRLVRLRIKRKQTPPIKFEPIVGNPIIFYNKCSSKTLNLSSVRFNSQDPNTVAGNIFGCSCSGMGFDGEK